MIQLAVFRIQSDGCRNKPEGPGDHPSDQGCFEAEFFHLRVIIGIKQSDTQQNTHAQGDDVPVFVNKIGHLKELFVQMERHNYMRLILK